MVIGTLTTSSTPDGCGQNAGAPLPSEASATSFRAALIDARRLSGQRELFAPRPVTINRSAPALVR